MPRATWMHVSVGEALLCVTAAPRVIQDKRSGQLSGHAHLWDPMHTCGGGVLGGGGQESCVSTRPPGELKFEKRSPGQGPVQASSVAPVPPAWQEPGHLVTGAPSSAGAVPPAQFPGLPSRSTIFQQQPESCSSPPGVALTCLGMQPPAQSQQVTIQVQEPADMLSSVPGTAPGSAGRGLPSSPGASQVPMQHRAGLMAAFSYGHRPLSKQLSADSADAHR